mmetsp:Transcript_5617/g.10088  ORF Transcript_5617/g.10088 Transcript_5617/m.10088 type:complete len:106 (-) Transcript_5617:9-326(-)
MSLVGLLVSLYARAQALRDAGVPVASVRVVFGLPAAVSIFAKCTNACAPIARGLRRCRSPAKEKALCLHKPALVTAAGLVIAAAPLPFSSDSPSQRSEAAWWGGT